MMARPTPSEERWIAAARRLARNARTEPFAGRAGGWKSVGPWSHAALFALGLVAALMIGVIGSLAWPHAQAIVTGFVGLAAAEWLIRRRRYFGSGIEEALVLVGWSMLAYECTTRFGQSVHVAAACFAVALVLAGTRTLNPVFTTLAAITLVFSIDAPPMGSALACYGIGLAALSAGARRFSRPSSDALLDYLVVAAPLAGYLWSALHGQFWIATDYRHASPSQWLVPACPLAFAAVAVAVGIRRRTHAPLVAAMLCVACCAYELRNLTGLRPETRLIGWGVVLLVASTLLERSLRNARHGLTSRPLRAAASTPSLLELGGSANLATASADSAPAPSFTGGGGRYGGGGAGGQY